jgi:hypothetical protein
MQSIRQRSKMQTSNEDIMVPMDLMARSAVILGGIDYNRA